jgi:hypothetical protein
MLRQCGINNICSCRYTQKRGPESTDVCSPKVHVNNPGLKLILLLNKARTLPIAICSGLFWIRSTIKVYLRKSRGSYAASEQEKGNKETITTFCGTYQTEILSTCTYGGSIILEPTLHGDILHLFVSETRVVERLRRLCLTNTVHLFNMVLRRVIVFNHSPPFH